MAQNLLLKPSGLYTFPNHLSATPQGALLKASNVVINRDSIAESRRGFKIYGNSMTSTAHQMFTYKNRLIRHFGTGAGTSLEYDSDGVGTFLPFKMVIIGSTHSNTTVDAITSTATLEVGMFVSGSGIPAGATIASIVSNVAITLSAAATTSVAGGSLTFTWDIAETTTGRRLRNIESNGNLYFTSSEGIRKVSLSDATWVASPPITLAGGIKALDTKLTINANPGFLTAQTVVAYRIVWGIKDTNNNLILGTPSQQDIIRNTDAVLSKTVDLKITIPQGITTAYFYQVYRTAVAADPAGTQDPGDEQQLVFEDNPTNTDLTNGYVTTTDITPKTFRAGGANLYTNQNSGEGILQANDIPPLAKDITTFKGYTFYANTITRQRLNVSLLSVTNFVANTSTLTITDGTTTNTYTFSAAEDVATKKVLISALATPAQQVDETARSLVHVINSQSSEIVYAYYLSGPTDVPGLILLEARKLNQPAFHLTANSTNTGDEFSPSVPVSGSAVISTNETSPNRIYYSKFQQPEAVPILNYLEVGPQDKAIIRIVALRDNLFVLKEDGVYRLSGLVAPFSVYPFDFSVNIKAPDSAVVLNNLIYLFSTQGVGTISDTGISVISRPIEDEMLKLLIPDYTNFGTATFGVSYESDRSYYLFTVSSPSDTLATQCFRYNTFTNTWTNLALSKRCGVVNSFDDRLYLGATDVSRLEQERKSFSRTDFSDREIALTLGSLAISGTSVALPSLTGITAGDILVQTQYLTIKQYNRLLSKLDNDAILTPHTYVSSNTAVAGNNLSDDLDVLIAHIRDDAGRQAVVGHTADASYTALVGAGVASFSALQSNYNALILLLNNDVGVGFKNYSQSSGTIDYEFNIVSVNSSTNQIVAPYSYPLIQGPLIIYNHINIELQFVPQYFQDVSMTKHVSEGTLIFEDSSFSTAILSYASDLSANFEDQSVSGNGNGIFGNTPYGQGLFGGNGSGVPFRSFLPKEKQRCRYINVKFLHKVGREIFSLYGLSLTFNPISQRGWR